MIVVFDTNIWLSQLGMRSPAASAVRFFLNHNDHQLGLPEVIKLEVERNLKGKLIGFIEEIRSAHRQLLTAFGTLREVVLPSDEDVQRMISELFASTGVQLIEVPFSQESAHSSFLKTINKLPPSDKTQEFKDGVIWADCLKLLEVDDVTLVTDDRAFFEARKPENGLASNLRGEASGCVNRMTVVESVIGLLDSIKHEIYFAEDTLKDTLLKKAEDNVSAFLQHGSFELGEDVKISHSLFATESPDKLYFDCSVEIACIDLLGKGDDAKVVLVADGFYYPNAATFDEVNMLSASLVLVHPEGETTQMRGGYARGTVLFSHRDVTNTVRYRL